MFPRHIWAQCTCKLPRAQLGMGPAPGVSSSHCPLSLCAVRWGWGRQFRGQWTVAGPLPHPAGQEFALPSNSAGLRDKLTPKLPLLLSVLCLGLACSRGDQAPPVPQRLLAHHPSHMPLGSPWSRTGAGGALRPLSACPALSWGTGWGVAGVPLSTRQDLTLSPSQRWG